MTACPWCGEDAVFDVLEAWPEERAFMLDACCEEAYELGLERLRGAERREGAAFLRESAGIEVRSLYEDGDALRLDFGLRLEPIEQRDAKAFVAAHHKHNRPPAGWRWGHAVWNGPDLVGVAMVGRAVARAIDPATVVEVNRVCVRRDLGARVAWNACSMLYGAACREARRRGFARVITYTLESEAAATVKAAGFVAVALTKGGSWSCKSRPRTDKAPTCRKVRWERELARGAA